MSVPDRSGEHNTGRLAVVSTPIGNVGDMSRRGIDALSASDLVFCEDTRHTGMLLSRLGIEKRRLISLNAHNEAARIAMAIDALGNGEDLALVSDAGTPLVSDPGARLVAAVIDAGYPVVAIPGASAVLAALVVSGFDVSRFEFLGFLPRSGRARAERIAAIAKATVPSIVFESPRRVVVTLADLASGVGDERRVVVARELTKLFEDVWRGSLGEAVKRAQASEPQGEHVLVIEGGIAGAQSDDRSVRESISALVEAGLSAADAARAVEVLLGVPHRVAYAQRLALDRATGTSTRGASPRPRKAKRGRTLR